MTEDDLGNLLRDIARRYRWLAYHVRNSRAGITQGDVGFPDWILAKPPRLLAVELKRSPREKLTPAQGAWAQALRACSGVEYRLWTPADIDEILEELGR